MKTEQALQTLNFNELVQTVCDGNTNLICQAMRDLITENFSRLYYNNQNVLRNANAERFIVEFLHEFNQGK